jgi:hypothetical protein
MEQNRAVGQIPRRPSSSCFCRRILCRWRAQASTHPVEDGKGAGAIGVASRRRPRLRHRRLQLPRLCRRCRRFAMPELLRPAPSHTRLALLQPPSRHSSYSIFPFPFPWSRAKRTSPLRVPPLDTNPTPAAQGGTALAEEGKDAG